MGTIDDQNAVVKYSNDWGRIADTNAFNDTTTWTEVPGETVTLQFTGTGITVYGEIASTGRRGAPVSAYSIDGGAATTFTGTQTSKNQYNVLFFQSPQLASGGHTLVITTKSENLFFLDYFQITNSPPSLSSPAAGPTSGTTVTVTQSAPTPSQVAPAAQTSSTASQSAPSSTTTTGSSTTAATNDRSSSSTNPGTLLATVTVTSSNGTPSDAALSSVGGASSRPKTGPIVGAVVGGLFLLALVSFLVLYLCRRRRKGILPLSSSGHTSNSASSLRPGRMTEVTPFHLSERNTSDISANALTRLDNQSSDTIPHTQYPTFLSASESSGSQALVYMSSRPSANATYIPVASALSGTTSEKPGTIGRGQYETTVVIRSNEGLGYDPPPQYMG